MLKLYGLIQQAIGQTIATNALQSSGSFLGLEINCFFPKQCNALMLQSSQYRHKILKQARFTRNK